MTDGRFRLAQLLVALVAVFAIGFGAFMLAQPLLYFLQLYFHIVLPQNNPPYLHKGPHNRNIHTDGLVAVQNTAQHRYALFCKDIW